MQTRDAHPRIARPESARGGRTLRREGAPTRGDRRTTRRVNRGRQRRRPSSQHPQIAGAVGSDKARARIIEARLGLRGERAPRPRETPSGWPAQAVAAYRAALEEFTRETGAPTPCSPQPGSGSETAVRRRRTRCAPMVPVPRTAAPRP